METHGVGHSTESTDFFSVHHFQADVFFTHCVVWKCRHMQTGRFSSSVSPSDSMHPTFIRESCYERTCTATSELCQIILCSATTTAATSGTYCATPGRGRDAQTCVLTLSAFARRRGRSGHTWGTEVYRLASDVAGSIENLTNMWQQPSIVWRRCVQAYCLCTR